IFARADHPLAFAFAIPSNTPNVTFIGRRPYAPDPEDAPLASRLDEIDAIVRFDRVLVPWERVFAYGDVRLANRLYDESGFYPHTMHQVVTRLIVKTEFFIGLMTRMADMFELTGAPHVREAIAECAGIAESLRALQLAAEASAAVNRWGVCTPDERPLYAALRLYGRSYAGIVAGLQRI